MICFDVTNNILFHSIVKIFGAEKFCSPEWVAKIFQWYDKKEISSDSFIQAINYLYQNGAIIID